MNVGDHQVFVGSQEEPEGIPGINGIRLNGILLSLLLAFSFPDTGGTAALANAAAEKTDETTKTKGRRKMRI